MADVDIIKGLIDQIQDIKKLFKKQNLTMFSTYDRVSRTKKKIWSGK